MMREIFESNRQSKLHTLTIFPVLGLLIMELFSPKMWECLKRLFINFLLVRRVTNATKLSFCWFLRSNGSRGTVWKWKL